MLLQAKKALRWFLLPCLAALLAVGCSGAGSSIQPNVIFVLTEDLDYESAKQMPNLRSLLLEQGTSFEDAFISQSL